jgi:hypothetical protein
VEPEEWPSLASCDWACQGLKAALGYSGQHSSALLSLSSLGTELVSGRAVQAPTLHSGPGCVEVLLLDGMNSHPSSWWPPALD